MEKLVSIIIPCFNKEKWLKEAIDSCLNQTYPHIEVIVIDDGSTDNSLEIIKSYGTKIIWETGENRGANYARNRGFVLSSGSYIQYLDADDYLLPEKIERQVNFLEETGADVVYSDEKHIRYLPDGKSLITDIKFDGLPEDTLELFLFCKVYIQTANPLFKREIVANSSGWDETLKAAQDIDFFRSVAMDGARFIYQPGCYLVYRRYESDDRITCNLANVWKFRLLATEKAEKKLLELDKLSTKYKKALAYFYCTIALFGCSYLNYVQYLVLLKKILSLEPSFNPDRYMFKNGGEIYKILNQVFGFFLAGIIYKFLKDLAQAISVNSNH
ncbi:MAG: glycosyltransferase [Xenococcaceae cyanobacterium MO_207.B15]|nr:glycosyltransferase [Xenococcaceae cyanobacterium MO_207.B15]